MIVTILQIIVAVFLIVIILLQTQGTGLSTAFGGSGEFYRSKRSIEKVMIWATSIGIILFGALSLFLLIPR